MPVYSILCSVQSVVHYTHQNAVIAMIASIRAAPNTEPITIAAISPPERPSDCESLSVTFGVMEAVGVMVGVVLIISKMVYYIK